MAFLATLALFHSVDLQLSAAIVELKQTNTPQNLPAFSTSKQTLESLELEHVS